MLSYLSFKFGDEESLIFKDQELKTIVKIDICDIENVLLQQGKIVIQSKPSLKSS